MMYKNNFAMAVKRDGDTLREVGRDGDTVVYMPFESEYSVFIKNNNYKRCICTVSIDGTEVASGLVINGLDSLNLERFLVDGDF